MPVKAAGGLRFGPCVTIRLLGEGGVGEVWLARNESEGGRLEAVKVLKVSDPGATERERFIREARAAMIFAGDDKIVRTYDVATQDGRLYIRMEYVEGAPLSALDLVPAADALPLFKRIAASLAVAHARGVVHRDVKPSNFIRTPDGRVKLVDFGIARAAGWVSLTISNHALGTPAYMSPEQWEDAKRVDARSDVYALGVTFYKLLTGRYPYAVAPGAPGTAYYAKLLSEDPLPVEPRPGVPEELAPVIRKAMARLPEDRYPDAVGVHDALRRIGRQP